LILRYNNGTIFHAGEYYFHAAPDKPDNAKQLNNTEKTIV